MGSVVLRVTVVDVAEVDVPTSASLKGSRYVADVSTGAEEPARSRCAGSCGS